jgi:hypothetical protein
MKHLRARSRMPFDAYRQGQTQGRPLYRVGADVRVHATPRDGFESIYPDVAQYLLDRKDR